MSSPTFSVIIPAYMAESYIGEAVKGVLDQSFTDFEIIVVDDASPDDTRRVVEGFQDPRIRYLVHEKNKGLPAARNTGIRASSGKFIAFLDHDDVFLPAKLDLHHSYFETHPDVGATYNSRFETGASTRIVRRLWVAPENIGLSDLVLGYPFSPSDVVFRREWLFDIGLLDEENRFHGEDLNTNCRLALAGCRFGRVDRALNLRRNYPARDRKNLDLSLKNVFRNLEIIFNDPRCPAEVIALRDRAYAGNYLVWAYMALAQSETELGQSYLMEAIQRDPGILADEARQLLDFLVIYCVDDERGELDKAMQHIFEQLPADTSVIQGQYGWALGRGYLLKAVEAVLWGRSEEGRAQIARAVQLRAPADEDFVRWITHQLLAYRHELGSEAVLKVLANLQPLLNQLGGHAGGKLTASFWINDAFADYHAGLYKKVPRSVVTALLKDPAYIADRGVVSILVRSVMRSVV